MRKRSIPVQIIVLIMLALSGCGDKITNTPEKQMEMLVPINEACFWHVQSECFEGTDILSYIWTNTPGPDDENNWYKVSWTNNNDIDMLLAKQTEDGLVYAWDTTKEKPYSLLGMQTSSKFGFLGSHGGKGSWDNNKFQTYLIAKYPVSYGDKWTMMSDEITDSDGITYTINDVMECINLHQTVVTPAGTFECIVYQETYEYSIGTESITGSEFTRYYYYAKGIGLVKILLIDYTTDDSIVEYDLINYNCDIEI
ncbi:MAG: hypothetical protein JXR56_05440 [Candidatus Cloacimonetes bacterium]|nr:hypothetical protein [Candidatus Cloacimonadota bacterium]